MYCNPPSQMLLIGFHHHALSSSAASSLLVLSKITCCQFYFRDFSQESPALLSESLQKPFLWKYYHIWGYIKKSFLLLWKLIHLTCAQTKMSLVLPLVPPYGVFLYPAETGCPSSHAVSLREWVLGAGVHWSGRVWVSLQMCEEAGWLLIRHKTFSPTSGGICQWVSQHCVTLSQKCTLFLIY